MKCHTWRWTRRTWDLTGGVSKITMQRRYSLHLAFSYFSDAENFLVSNPPMNTILHISKTHTGTWIVFTSSAVFGKRTVLHTHWPTIDFDVIMLDTHAVSIKIPRVQHEFYEDQSQTIETFRQALQMDQERIFNKSMIETSRIIRRTAISEETLAKRYRRNAIVLAFRKLFSPVVNGTCI
ncbi:unnamed protein product [Caenorhabditis nigoni]